MGFFKKIKKGIGGWIKKIRDKRKNKGKKNILAPLSDAVSAYVGSDYVDPRLVRPSSGIGKPNYNNFSTGGNANNQHSSNNNDDFMDDIKQFFGSLKWWGWGLVGLGVIYIKDTMLTKSKNDRMFFGK